jgi:hypothetical protein
MRHYPIGYRRPAANAISVPGAPRPVLAVLLAIAAGGLTWCRVGSKPALPPPVLLVGADVSLSVNPKERRRLCGILDLLVERVLPAHSRVVVWSFDVQARKVYAGRPQGARELWPVVDRMVIAAHAARQPGTYPALVLQESLREAYQTAAHAEPIGILILSDGEDADMASTRKLVRELAQLNNLKAVWVLGVALDSDQDLRRQVESTYAPLGDRLIVSGPFDRTYGFAEFQHKLTEEGHHDH